MYAQDLLETVPPVPSISVAKSSPSPCTKDAYASTDMLGKAGKGPGLSTLTMPAICDPFPASPHAVAFTPARFQCHQHQLGILQSQNAPRPPPVPDQINQFHAH
eukprot:7664019-Ditylum_brightwellii.AAC.1